MKKTTAIIGLIVLAFLVFQTNAPAQLKKRVAVFTFEDKSDHAYSWWGGKSAGEGMADMLTTELVKSGKYSVIERMEISKVIEEQQLGQSGMVTPQSAAEVGKMLGVELAIMGSITEFGYSQKEMGGRVKGFGLGTKKQSSTVAVDVRFVNTTTGEILTAENVRKEKSSSGLSVSTPQIDFRNETDFDNSLVGKVTREAITDIMVMIDKGMENLPWAGKVLTVRGSDIFMKPGSDAGVKVGDSFTVYAVGEALIDPDTGISLGSDETKVGTIQVTEIVAGGKAAKATAKAGTGFKQGDLIRLK